MELADAEHRRERGLEQRLPRLAVHAREGGLVHGRELVQGRDVGEARGEVAVRDAQLRRDVEVAHRRRDDRGARVEARLEGRHALVLGGNVEERLGRREVHHHDALEAARALEVLHVLGEERDLLAVALHVHDVIADDLLGVLAREDGRPRRDRLELVLDLLELLARKDLVVHGGLEHVRVPDVPAREDEVLERREVEERGRARWRARRSLGNHSKAGREATNHQLYAGDQGRRDRSVDSDDDDSDFAHWGALMTAVISDEDCACERSFASQASSRGVANAACTFRA